MEQEREGGGLRDEAAFAALKKFLAARATEALSGPEGDEFKTLLA